MRVIVHAGCPKTGSSAIQGYLHRNRVRLRHRSGIVYPDCGTQGHWRIAAALKTRRTVSEPDQSDQGHLVRRFDDGSAERVLAGIRTVIGQVEPDEYLLLSQENFSDHRSATALMEFLGSIVSAIDVTFVAYVRDPVSLYPSFVQQMLKNDSLPEAPGEWVNPHPIRVRKLASVVQRPPILRAFDRRLLVDGDVVTDFRQVIGEITDRPLPRMMDTAVRNVSISAPGCALLLRHNVTSDQRHGAALLDAIRDYEEENSARKFEIPEAWSPLIAARNRRSWNALVESLDYDRAGKALLHVEAGGTQARVTQADVARWIDGHFDAGFAAGVLNRIKTTKTTSAFRHIIQWMESDALNSRIRWRQVIGRATVAAGRS